MKKCLKLVASGVNAIPGTGSLCMVLVYLTILGLGASIIFVDVLTNYKYRIWREELKEDNAAYGEYKVDLKFFDKVRWESVIDFRSWTLGDALEIVKLVFFKRLLSWPAIYSRVGSRSWILILFGIIGWFLWWALWKYGVASAFFKLILSKGIKLKWAGVIPCAQFI